MSASLITLGIQQWSGAKFKSSCVLVVFFFTLWFMPPPEGLSSQTWHLFTIFVSTVVGIILKPLPMGSLAIVSIVICVFTNTLTLQQSLSSFSSKIVWLVLIAFLLARGFIKTGLGARVAYIFVYFFGKNTLSLSYSLIMTELLLAPLIPSNTARGAGIICPIVTSLSKEYKSDPADNTQRRVGAFLIKVCFQANIITSAIFMTAMAANPLITTLAEDFNVQITWTSWAKAAIVPGIINLTLLPLVIYLFYPPEIKETPEAKEFACQQLKKMGPISFHEFLMLATFGLLLFLWILGDALGIDPTSSALLGLALLLVSGVLSWDDIIAEKSAWSTFIWLCALLTMTSFLAKFGMMNWFSAQMHDLIAPFSWEMALAMLTLVYFYTHYLFASLTAHVTSLYAAFTIVAISSGTPPTLAALVFAFASSLSACLTHYGTGTAPVYLGTGYVSLPKWWQLGGIISIVNILLWATVGLSWWKFIGIW